MLFALAANIAPALFAAEKPTLLTALKSPVLFRGNDQIAYRAPLLIRNGGTFCMFYSPGKRQRPSQHRLERRLENMGLAWETMTNTTTTLKRDVRLASAFGKLFLAGGKP